MIIKDPKALKQALISIKRVTLKRDKWNYGNVLTKINVKRKGDKLIVLACNGHIATRRIFDVGDDPDQVNVDFSVLIDPSVIPSNVPTDRVTINENFTMMTFYKLDANTWRYTPLALSVTPCDESKNKYIDDEKLFNVPDPSRLVVYFNKESLINAINASSNDKVVALTLSQSPLSPMRINGDSEEEDTIILPERIIAKHMRKAQGDGRRVDVQAARRCLEKRGIDWKKGENYDE